MTTSPIPLIDLSEDASPHELARQISNAVKTVGFLHVRGVGISRDDVKRVFAIVSWVSLPTDHSCFSTRRPSLNPQLNTPAWSHQCL